MMPIIENYFTREVILYLLPALGVGLTVLNLARITGIVGMGVFLLAGTFMHELLHFVVGFFLNAKPMKFNIIPKKIGKGQYTLGYVQFSNLRWYNAVFVGMAPLLSLGLVVAFANWRVSVASLEPTLLDVVTWFILGQMIVSSIPSGTDFRISLQSWPLFLMGYFVATSEWLPKTLVFLKKLPWP